MAAANQVRLLAGAIMRWMRVYTKRLKQSGGEEWTRSKQGRADLKSAALTTVQVMSPTCDH